jgi:hypothetical protein
MRWTRTRTARLTALTTLASAVFLVMAAPAYADVDSSDCDSAALGAICYEYELLRSETGVALSGEESVLKKVPAGTAQDAATTGKLTKTASYKITNAVSEAKAFAWSFGAGKIITPVTGNTEFSGGLNGSGTTTVTTTSETSITWSSEYTISHDAVPVRRGYEIFTNVVGNRYEVNQRQCEKKVWGLYCYDWQTMIVEAPTGINIREQGLGWTQTLFRACNPGGVVWKTHYRPEKVGTPSIFGCLNTNFATNTYTIASTGGVIMDTGTFATTSIELNNVYDPDTIVIALQGNYGGSGTVTITRDPYAGEGNTVRTGRMDSDLVTVPIASQGTQQFYGGVEITGWPLS